MTDSYVAKVLLVILGGGVGSGLRFMISGGVDRSTTLAGIPWGTLAVNVLGCLAIGFLAGMHDRGAMKPEARLLLIVGVLGGLTTFSTFALDTIRLAHDQSMGRALINMSLHAVCGLAAVWIGFVGERLLSPGAAS